MKLYRYILLASLCFAVFPLAALAQETETKVVDEVVAQVNDGVITLSRIRREAKDIVEGKVQAGEKREDAQKAVDAKQGELIANLINEELLIQKAKEIGVADEVEATLNQRFVEIMKQYDLKTLDSLYEEMRKQNVDPVEMREMWRKQATREKVIQREVQAKIYWDSSGKQLKDYYEKNKSKFTKPETVTLSEIYLNFAGRDEAAVRAKAKDLVSQLRNGADFVKLVEQNSDRPNAAQNKGKADTVVVKELDEKFAKVIKDLKAGSYTDPIEIDGLGVTILRIDERTAASNESQYDENAVRLEIMRERAPEEQRKFMSQLRSDSYIKISESYRPLVSPILFADERKEKPGN
ncbi:MAG: peptidylprolyl isomerase [Acidobacteria bacterium]|nr:peptidylprolyl isomerase [Acidobacteriota bacterium]